MFKKVSQDIRQFFSANSDFNSVMNRNGKIYLFPIMASEKNELPLSTYVLGQQTPETKEMNQMEITVNFWFQKDSYDECCDFTDKMTVYIESSQYNFISSVIDFDEQTLNYFGQLTFSLI